MAAGARDELEQAEESWRLCLEAGGMEAHFGLGYTLLDLGRPHDAYRHLRFYTELTPSERLGMVLPRPGCGGDRGARGGARLLRARGCARAGLDLETDAAERLDTLRRD